MYSNLSGFNTQLLGFLYNTTKFTFSITQRFVFNIDMWNYLFISDYIKEIYQLLIKLEPNAQKTLEDQAPAPIKTMLTKQPREEAIIKQAERKAMVTLNVPPTNGEHQSHVKCSVLIISCKILD